MFRFLCENPLENSIQNLEIQRLKISLFLMKMANYHLSDDSDEFYAPTPPCELVYPVGGTTSRPVTPPSRQDLKALASMLKVVDSPSSSDNSTIFTTQCLRRNFPILSSVTLVSPDTSGDTVLSRALRIGRTHIVHEIARGAGAALATAPLSARGAAARGAAAGWPLLLGRLLRAHPPLASSWSPTGETPLHVAAAGHPLCVRVLVGAGAGARADQRGVTPLHVAAAVAPGAGYFDPDARYTPEPMPRDHSPENGLDISALAVAPAPAAAPAAAAAGGACWESPGACEDTFAHLLTVCRGFISSPDNDGRTPLHWAAARGAPAAARALLDAGADTAATDRHGQTPLMVAVRAVKSAGAGAGAGTRARAVLAVLLRRGGGHLPDRDGHTPLDVARKVAGVAELFARETVGGIRECMGCTETTRLLDAPDEGLEGSQEEY